MSKAIALVPVWVRAVLACVTIPALWALEVWMSLLMIRAPEEVFGDAGNLLPASVFSVFVGLALLWMVCKTPFAILSMAFPTVHPNTEGGVQQ